MDILTNRRNDVAQNVVLGTLLGEGLSEANHGQLGSRVVCLAEATEQTGSGGGVDDTAKLLLPEMGPCSAGALVGARDVDLDDEIPVLILEVLEADVAEDTGVVEEDIDATKSLDGRLDDAVTVLDAVVVGNSLAARGDDFVDTTSAALKEEHVNCGAHATKCDKRTI